MSTQENKGLRRWTDRRRLLLRWVFLPYAALLVFYLVIFRFLRMRSVMNGVRAFNKQILNPAMMTLAGRRHWYASVMRHVGRRSGKEYSTPVVVEPVGDGFITPLPYGQGVDWLKDVLAAGRATIEAKGATYTVVEPEVIDAEAVFPLLSPRLRRTWRLFGIERFLKLKWHPDVGMAEDRRPGEFAKVQNLSP